MKRKSLRPRIYLLNMIAWVERSANDTKMPQLTGKRSEQPCQRLLKYPKTQPVMNNYFQKIRGCGVMFA